MAAAGRVVCSLLLVLLHAAGTRAQVCIVSPGAPPTATSLVDSQDFSVGRGSWRNLYGGDVTRGGTDTANPYLVSAPRLAPQDGPFYPIAFIRPGATFRLTAWINVAATTDPATVTSDLILTDAQTNGQTFPRLATTTITPGCWSFINVTFQTTAYTVDPTGIVFNGPPQSVQVLLDSVSIVALSTLTPFPPPPALVAFPPVGTFYTGDTRKCAAIPGPVVVPTGAVNLIRNPGFELGVAGWTTSGSSGKLNVSRVSKSNQNPYLVTSNRGAVYSGPAQDIDAALIQRNMPYVFSAWVRVTNVDSQFIQVSLFSRGASSGPIFSCLGSVVARTGCWSLISGSTTFEFAPTSLRLYFEGPTVFGEVWVDSVVLYQGNDMELRASQELSITTNRKRDVALTVLESDGKPVQNAAVKVEQTSSAFLWGVEVDASITSNVAYQNYIKARKFNQIQFADELLWKNMQPNEGLDPDYTVTDAMVAWAQSNNISLRGFNIFSEDASAIPTWVQSKTRSALLTATEARVSSLLNRYKGRFFGWDVDAGMLSRNFYDINRQANFFQEARLFDPKALLFMNEEGTTVSCGGPDGNTDKYLAQLARLKKLKAPVTALAMASNFYDDNFVPAIPLPYSIKVNVDKLGSSGLPLYVTSLSFDFADDQRQADYLETAMRAFFSNPKVQGISLATTTRNCKNFCISDLSYNPNLAGLRYDTLRALWSTNLNTVTTASGNAFFSGFLGSYKITVTKANGNQSVFTVPLSASRTPAKVTLKFKK